jgi:hypothetical protein
MKMPRAAVWLLIACPVLMTTCSEDDPQCPSDGVMKIEGTVASADGPSGTALVQLDCYDSSLRMSLLTNAAGEYAVDVPDGRYRLGVNTGRSPYVYWTSAGATYRAADAEWISVGGNRPDLHADILMGRLEVSLRKPSDVPEWLAIGRLIDARSGEVGDEYYGRFDDDVAQLVFKDVPPGRYRLSFDVSGSRFWLPHTLDSTEVREFEVRPLETSSLADTLPEPAYLTGRLIGAWTRASTPQGAFVSAYGPDSVDLVGVRTDVDGRFVLPVLTDGVVRLMVAMNNVMMWVGGGTYEDADRWTASLGSSVDVGSIQTNGIVCTMIGEMGWETQEWTATVASGPITWSNEALPTRAAGVWVIPLSGPMDVMLRVQSRYEAAWRSQWYDRRATQAEATLLHVDDAVAPTAIDIHLERGGTISGRLLAHDGSPLAYRSLLCRTEGEYQWNGRSSEDGSFQVQGLVDGAVLLGLSVGGDILWYPGTPVESEAEPIEIINAGAVTGIEFVLPASSN